MIRNLAIRWAVLAVAVWVTTSVVSGIEVVDGSIGTYLLIAAIFATVNALLGSILRLLTFPLIVLTLGFFSLVISALMLLVTDWLMDSFEVDGFAPSVLGRTGHRHRVDGARPHLHSVASGCRRVSRLGS